MIAEGADPLAQRLFVERPQRQPGHWPVAIAVALEEEARPKFPKPAGLALQAFFIPPRHSWRWSCNARGCRKTQLAAQAATHANALTRNEEMP
ncbi:hypothetical protein Aave_3588 [Paracidovorax citrulli AAC00-1]|uniref:Uncharacterized protein n=1 Tax=Paracidovorax citrulli (strain AAC00-1) TaxID=397945 RepID=A1TT51_PARC0|nr:hypothetical protein Aave_3588 [Paracidovorax citrulli AAC00-1]